MALPVARCKDAGECEFSRFCPKKSARVHLWSWKASPGHRIFGYRPHSVFCTFKCALKHGPKIFERRLGATRVEVGSLARATVWSIWWEPFENRVFFFTFAGLSTTETRSAFPRGGSSKLYTPPVITIGAPERSRIVAEKYRTLGCGFFNSLHP